MKHVRNGLTKMRVGKLSRNIKIHFAQRNYTPETEENNIINSNQHTIYI